MPNKKLILCDDDSIFAKLFQKTLADIELELNMRLSLDIVADGYAMLEKLQSGTVYDLFFLDIEMPGIDGIKLAKVLHERNHEAAIIYLTSHINYAPEAIKNKPHRYIIKSNATHLKDDMREAITTALFSQETSSILPLRTYTDDVFIKTPDILYITVKGNNLRVRCKNEEYIANGSFSDVADKLPGSFVRCHRNFIVNTAHIYSIHETCIRLNNNEKLPCSERLKSTVMGTLLRQMGG